ncbi:MAG: endolytic transglycosylase MltG [Oscillospiraceae bacterium]|jgi:UPF0755 protein|nr:endolytic transglycosylase MltG [Oscillospiraceae bacterium]
MKIYKTKHIIKHKFYLVLLFLFFIVFIFFVKKTQRRSCQPVVNTIKVTFKEGLNIIEVASILEDNGIVPKDEFLKTCNLPAKFSNYWFLPKNCRKGRYYVLEGYLYPDTYYFFSNEDADSVLDKFLKNFEEKTKNLDLQSETNLDNVITIASVLQLESNPKDAARVASVIYNRIHTKKNGGISKFGEFGMNFLQLDSTVWYPYKNRSEAPVGFESNYDTYSIHGLPAGAVCSPSLEFIKSALHPENTEYFYFCNDEKGNIFYAKKFNEHSKNLARIKSLSNISK